MGHQLIPGTIGLVCLCSDQRDVRPLKVGRRCVGPSSCGCFSDMAMPIRFPLTCALCPPLSAPEARGLSQAPLHLLVVCPLASSCPTLWEEGGGYAPSSYGVRPFQYTPACGHSPFFPMRAVALPANPQGDWSQWKTSVCCRVPPAPDIPTVVTVVVAQYIAFTTLQPSMK